MAFFGIDSLAERLRQRFRQRYPNRLSVMRKIEWSSYITQSLICAGLLAILILRGYANGISTLSGSQNYSSTDEIEQRSTTKNSQQLCSNIPMAKPVTRTELFFGLRKPNGIEVNHAEFQRFLDREVTPRFPDGFTVISGQGQFKDARDAILQERSKLLILLYPIAATRDSPQERLRQRQIEQIRTAYTTTFQQQSVLRADNLSCAAF
jgi:Protein of unknown function (DUF3574)